MRKKKPASETPLLDMLRNDPNRVTTEDVSYFYGVPIYSFASWPKEGLNPKSFSKDCYAWVKNRS